MPHEPKRRERPTTFMEADVQKAAESGLEVDLRERQQLLAPTTDANSERIMDRIAVAKRNRDKVKKKQAFTNGFRIFV